MDYAVRQAAGHRRKPLRQKRSAGKERRRLTQLLVSLALFLLVFIGRGVFPAQLQSWRAAMAQDTDFAGAVRQFSAQLKEKISFREAFQDLLTAVSGEGPSPSSAADVVQQGNASGYGVQVKFLGETPRGGLDYLLEHSFVKDLGHGVQADPQDTAGQTGEQVSGSAPSPQKIVTAMAQAYDKNGVALPSNVSYEYYELGLNQTAAPVRGTVTSNFEYRTSPITGKREFHLAMDIAAKEGTEIGAFADGTVRYIGESDEFGQYLMLDHANGVSTFYAHCSKLLVRKGQTVSCGQTVALVGHTGKATGSHLHLTVLKDNIRLDPAYYVDPS